MNRSKEDVLRSANDRILGQGDLDFVDEVFTPDYVLHAGGREHKGPRFVRRFVAELRSALPNLRVVKVEILLAKGDTVAWQRTLSGTHRADLKGIPPSGKKVRWQDILVTRFEGGRIAEEWAVSDLAGELLLAIPGRA